MNIRLDEDLYKEIQKITSTDYDSKGDFIPSESIEPMLNDLILEINRLEEKIKDIERDIEENYRPIPVSEQYGISDRDFY